MKLIKLPCEEGRNTVPPDLASFGAPATVQGGRRYVCGDTPKKNYCKH